MNNRLLLLIYLIGILSGWGCSLGRTLPEDTYLHKGAKVEIKKTDQHPDTKQLNTTYQTIIQKPKPNKHFLGIRWGLRMHNLFHTKKQKGLWRWCQKKLGAEPVIYDEQVTTQIEKILENKAFNLGFFNVEVSSKVQKKRKKASVKYLVELKESFGVKSIANVVSDSLIRQIINKNQTHSLLKIGEPYRLQTLKQERERITTLLRRNGYYFFRDTYLKFKADTTLHKNQIALELTLQVPADSTHLKKKTIHRIYVFPDLSAVQNNNLTKDTLEQDGLTIIYHRTLIHPSVLRAAITLKAGQLYSPIAHQKTLERLSSLRNHQFIDIQFKPSEAADTLLNVYVRLTPRKRNAIEGSLGLSLKSSIYIGAEFSLTYLNRNLFKGAEQFRINTFRNFNFPLTDGLASQQEYGLAMELSKPGIILPFRKKAWPEGLIANSKVAFTFSSETIRFPLNGIKDFLEVEGFPDLLNRLNADTTFAPFIALENIDFSLAYQWQRRVDIRHQTLLNLILQFPRYELEELRELVLILSQLDDSSEELFLNLEKMLIVKPNYTFFFDSRRKKLKTHNYFYRGKAAISGNTLLSKDLLVSRDSLEGQFFQVENDFRYFWQFSAKQSIGFRFASNVSVPFNNEVILPFFDLYNIGGPNSIRAFQPRRVGPGSVAPSEDLFFFTGTGDVLLESTLEWRPKINDLFELGFFVDAGNVWLLKGREGEEELATFNWNNFHKQLAIGTGMGIRLDFDILILRLDLAFPLTKPWLPEGKRGVANAINFGRSDWRKENLTYNLAFGYSF